MGGSSPNSDFYYFGKFCVPLFFVCCFHVFEYFKIKIENWIGGGWMNSEYNFTNFLPML